MDDCRFDNLTRMVGGMQDRRVAIRNLTGAGAALVSLARADLGLAADDDVLVEGCRLTGERCKRHNNCCSGKCKGRKKKHGKNDNHKGKNKREGTCRCLGNGKKCSKDAACCRGRCKDRKCRCVGANNLCNKDNDCCGKRKCVKDGGNRVCKHR